VAAAVSAAAAAVDVLVVVAAAAVAGVLAVAAADGASLAGKSAWSWHLPRSRRRASGMGRCPLSVFGFRAGKCPLTSSGGGGA